MQRRKGEGRGGEGRGAALLQSGVDIIQRRGGEGRGGERGCTTTVRCRYYTT